MKAVRTLPCLELCGAELLAHLLSKTHTLLNKPVNGTYLWTDSQIVLGWLSSHASNWKPFVANRVSRIQELTHTASWRYVSTKSNAADIVSRGATVNELKESCWFTGPAFLRESHEHWSTRQIKLNDLPEKRKTKTILSCAAQISFVNYIYKWSSFSRTRRIFAYLWRFINNIRQKQKGEKLNSGHLTASELEAATLLIVKIIQHQEFLDEIISLKRSTPGGMKGATQILNSFLDELDLLRVSGRLKNADLPYGTKHPLLLPKDNPFVKSYLIHLHRKNLHAGPQALVALSRQHFWIINARNFARRVVKECLHCFRYKPKLMQQLMGNLPERRLVGSGAFENVGVDFCGPIWTTYNIRGRRPYKSYICVFVCFLSRGVHIEVVSDLSSEAFIAALKRFISRRRLCKHLYCDNATNFVGAKKLLEEFKAAFLSQSVQASLAQWCAEDGVQFHHIPPRAPHFGDIWEAAVQSAKAHLFRTLQSAILTFEELSTVCCQIEATLNSRPICQLSSDPNDEEVLTPAHFWGQAPLNCLLEPDTSGSNLNYIQRWRRISTVQQHFWKQEYLSSLNCRYKWKTISPNLLVGSLVLISDDALPPHKWLLGKVVNVIAGRDNMVRVADVKTRAGIFRRTIHKLAPLPTPDDS